MTPARRRRAALALALALTLLGLAGCGPGVDTTYGRSRWGSVNGTSVLAGLFRARGHEVRAAVRLTDELSGWAEVLVRFAPAPGPPPRDEAAWYDQWLNAGEGRRIVYVPRDYDATHEYWSRALAQLPKDAPTRTRERIEEARAQADGWAFRLPRPPKHTANPEDWFSVETGKPAEVCKALGGPWTDGLDEVKAALSRHETLKVDSEVVLLSGDGKPLVITWDRFNGSRVLVAAGGMFLLNLPLVEPARWPLAVRAVDWACEGEGENEDGETRPTRPKRVAFVEGAFVLSGEASSPSVFRLLTLPPFGWVAGQLFVLGLAACLARAPRLGRARGEEASGADRPVAHPEALGALLARTGQAREARAILDAYRRWRNGPAGRGPGPP